MRYTTKIHEKMLIKMLDSDNPCSYINCPKAQFSKEYNLEIKFCFFPRKICNMCVSYIKLSMSFSKVCPCSILGSKEALKRTYLKLEERGVI